MQVFDASSMIYAWDNYPIRQFPGLWEWISTQIDAGSLVMPVVAFEEVEDKTPECAEWLKGHDIDRLGITNTILQDAIRIKGLIGITNENYHSKGVGENDLLIIATARNHRGELVSDEERQTSLPNEPRRKKIPAVCAMPEVSVPCINFLDYLKRSDAIFR
ncbi:MAG: DUF4411 family protein [Geobacteraceae bacterium]